MRSILLVDDDEDDRDFFLTVLNLIDSSLTYDTAQDGFVALRHLSAAERLPDIIFLDLNMPVMNGKQFLSEIKRNDRLKNIPIIILSTSSDQATISETFRLGGADFITKPNKLALLETRLREILNNSAYK